MAKKTKKRPAAKRRNSSSESDEPARDVAMRTETESDHDSEVENELLTGDVELDEQNALQILRSEVHALMRRVTDVESENEMLRAAMEENQQLALDRAAEGENVPPRISPPSPPIVVGTDDPPSRKRLVPRLSVAAPKPFSGKGDDVEHFVRKLHRYFELCRVPAELRVDYAAHFLEGAVDKQWDTHYEILKVQQDVVTWSDFEQFLLKSFGKIAPMTQYFKDYENCVQSSTVTDYVTRLRTCLSKLKGSFLEVSEGLATIKFLKGLKSDISRQVQAAAPEGWWGSIDEAYSKALTFETNQVAMIRSSSDAPNDADKRRSDDDKRSKAKRSDDGAGPSSPRSPAWKVQKTKGNEKGKAWDRNPDKSVFIPKDEWNARLKAKRCPMCGDEGHKECTKKDATPFRR